MSQPPSIQELRDATGISQSYASMILSGARKSIPRPLAIAIRRGTGWTHPAIATLSDDQIATLEAIDPWPRPTSQAAAA